MSRKWNSLIGAGFAATTVISLVALAQPAAAVVLQNATATFSQVPFVVGQTIDGNLGLPAGTSVFNGWAINPAATQTAVWETATDLNASALKFGLIQNFGGSAGGQHTIGRFRVSVTSDDRSLFADGSANGGDVSATWVELTAPLVSLPALTTFTTGGALGNSILIGGASPNTATYSVTYSGTFTNITGVRLEVLEHPSLPSNGPGRQPTNGNFVLTEFTLTAVPEPTTVALFGLGLAGLGFARRRKAA